MADWKDFAEEAPRIAEVFLRRHKFMEGNHPRLVGLNHSLRVFLRYLVRSSSLPGLTLYRLMTINGSAMLSLRCGSDHP